MEEEPGGSPLPVAKAFADERSRCATNIAAKAVAREEKKRNVCYDDTQPNGGRMSDQSFTAVIVDDEPLAIEGLKRHCAASGIASVIGEASDGAAGLALIGEMRPDVVFLDISMPGLGGLEVARAVASAQGPPLVVFVTAHDHYATEAFDLAVVDYVLKPIEPKRMRRALERLSRLIGERAPQEGVSAEFWVPFRGRIVRLSHADIIRIEAERDYVRLFSSENSYLVRATLTDMLTRLHPKAFVRVHRSIAVARNRMTAFRHVGGGAWAVVDPEGAETPIGRSYLASVREAENF
jgi:two-component system response regulator AlgR